QIPPYTFLAITRSVLPSVRWFPRRSVLQSAYCSPSVLYALSAPNVRGNLLDSSYAGLRELPHSRQQVLRRDVINPQNGHILCDRKSGSTGLRVASSFVNESVMKARFLRMRVRKLRTLRSILYPTL